MVAPMFVQRVLWVILVLAVLGGCSKNGGDAESPESSMSPEEARLLLTEFGKKHGITAPTAPDPTTLAQVLEILLSDQTSRFAGALRFLEGKQGGDILTIRAMLELSWSDGFTTVSDVLAELNRRSGLEVDRLTKREAEGTLTDPEAATLEKLQAQIEEADQARVASETLAEDHLTASASLASEAVKQGAAGATEPLTALAFYQLLSGNWLEFDEVMNSLRPAAPDSAMVHYLNALESLQRFTLRNEARAELNEALKVQPKFVRAQAKLVLLQDDIASTYAEFTKLKTQSPGHPILALVGQLVVEEYEASVAMQKARGH